ncbi:NADP-dependent oxidoreductase [Fodinicola acaciae]|uniref:NADP-dependent oxidoreductase n=1 Tax=Fodinicola acaciae TaxID=2681555 RepID=UPI0013D8C3E2|nr:NADP-dependent oxidoreductase [Fodinicola acaciae]
MKAMRYPAYGDSDVLAYEETGEPVAGAGQVVVRVAGTGFNMLDVAIRLGILRDAMPIRFPHTPNVDVSGVISAVGDGVTGWSVGDAVVAFLPATEPGAAAEYVVVPAKILAAAPRSGELADAAALPVAGLTAWQALFEYAELTAGQTVLVNGAGGGVGGFAVQLAKRAGATVTATASRRSQDRVRSYGADEVVDYTATPVLEAVAGRRFDIVLQLVRASAEETAQLAELVADGGVFVSTTTPGPDHVRTRNVMVRSDAAQLTDLVGLVDRGELVVDVVDRRPLTDLAAVHDAAAAGKLTGKTVLTP